MYVVKNYTDRRDLHNSRNFFLDIRVSCHLKLSMPIMKALKDCGILKCIDRRTGRMRIRPVNLLDRTSPESGFSQFAAPQGCQRLELGCCSETAPYKCHQVYARGEISLEYAVQMYNLSGTSRLIFCVMYVLWKRIFSQWLRTGFLSVILVIGSKNLLLLILAWAALVVEQHY